MMTSNIKVPKDRIPKALREQVWLTFIGKRYSAKCTIHWCKNEITVFDFHVGHNVPESKGGETILQNLRPICARCNLSMSNNYTIDDWNKLGNKTNYIPMSHNIGGCCLRLFNCFRPKN